MFLPQLPITVSAGASLEIGLWRAHPSVTYLKPPLPGAMLGDAVFLENGRLALQVALPDGERQAWTFDPDAHLATQRLGDIAAHAPIAVRPDGQAIAVLQPRTEAAGTASSLAFSETSPPGRGVGLRRAPGRGPTLKCAEARTPT